MNNPSTHHMLRPLFMLCLMTFGCQRESILTTAPPALSIIPAVDLPQQHFGTDRNPQNRQDSTTTFTPTPDSPIELDLGSVRASALENNFDIQVDLLAIDTAESSLAEARSVTDPTLSASINRSSSDSPAAQDTQGSQNDNSSASVGLTMPLGSGDSLDVRLPWFRSSTNAAFSLSSYNAAQIDVTYRSPLNKGRGTKN